MDWFFGYMRWAVGLLNPFSSHRHSLLIYTTQVGYQAAVLLILILILGAPLNTLAVIRYGFGG